MAAQDASFISKSGKKTYGLDRFYNGCAGRPERGLEISVVAVVDVRQKGAYVAAVAQTPATPELKKEQADAMRWPSTWGTPVDNFKVLRRFW